MSRLSLDDVLGTNYVPTEDERRLISALISSMKEELSSLNNIILPLLAKHDKLSDHNLIPTKDETCLPSLLISPISEELTSESANEIVLPLLAKRDKLNERILSHEALLTPARRLLPELVSEIFTHTIPPGPSL
ncbi:hypothetical protein BD410DRAFT_769969, partial [Rickenella mellea]